MKALLRFTAVLTAALFLVPALELAPAGGQQAWAEEEQQDNRKMRPGALHERGHLQEAGRSPGVHRREGPRRRHPGAERHAGPEPPLQRQRDRPDSQHARLRLLLQGRLRARDQPLRSRHKPGRRHPGGVGNDDAVYARPTQFRLRALQRSVALHAVVAVQGNQPRAGTPHFHGAGLLPDGKTTSMRLPRSKRG